MGDTTATQLKLGAQSTAVGDRVTDKKEQPETTPMRVLDPNIGLAGEIEVNDRDDDDTTVADYDGNEPYPTDDPVVKVVYETQLDNRVRGWETMVGAEFPDQLKAYADQWGVSVETHKFPVSRLEKLSEQAGQQTQDQANDTTEGSV